MRRSEKTIENLDHLVSQRSKIQEEFHSNPQNVTLWLFNIAMENSPFIDGLPIKNGDFPWLC